jgi:hypothetical protein
MLSTASPLSRSLGANVLGTSEHGFGATPGITEDCKWWNIVLVYPNGPIITRALGSALTNTIIVMRSEMLSVALTCYQHS